MVDGPQRAFLSMLPGAIPTSARAPDAAGARRVNENPSLAIDGASLVTSRGRRRASLYVQDGQIFRVSEEILPAATRIEAGGLLLVPGFVDTHVHLMEPAESEREDWAHGTAAAATSGVTTIIEHTHAAPIQSVDDLDDKRSYVSERSLVDYGLAAHAWQNSLSRVEELWRAGVAFFKVFTCTTHGIPGFESGPLLDLLREVARIDAVCLVHCEDESITRHNEQRLRAEGRRDGGAIAEWRSREAELLAVTQVLMLARITGARVVVAHASHKAVLDLVRSARADGAPVIAESCPQYLLLHEDEILQLGPLRKFTPPARIRSDSDSEAMWSELRSGDVLHHMSSDHAPSTRKQKARGIWNSPFGLPGLDTTSSLLIDAAVTGVISFERLVEAYAEAPARAYGLTKRKGTLVVGRDADFVLIDPECVRPLHDRSIRSKAGWTPYAGRRVRGRVVSVYLRGRQICDEGRIVAPLGVGEFVAGVGTRS
jgi:dihydroorotase (multifunctional complex type)